MDENDVLGDHRLGVSEIDSEHALQMSVIGAFRSAVAREDQEAQRIILDRLVDYSNAHFMAEAMMMRLHVYPEAEAHLVEHRKLLDDLAMIKGLLGSKDALTTQDLPERLERWFAEHLERCDRPFARFLAQVNALPPQRLGHR